MAAKTRAISSSTGIGSHAFAYCPNLEMVTVHWDSPLSISPNTFEGVDLSKLTLLVPETTVPAYKSADVWKEFGEIIEFEPSDINVNTSTSFIDNSDITPRFTLSGQRATDSYHGIVIVNGRKVLTR